MRRAPGSSDGSAGPRSHDLGDVLVAAALVFTAAVVASATAMVISVFGVASSLRLVDDLQVAADRAVTLLHAGLLVGASLLLVAARFHDVDTPWFPRALALVGAVAVLAVVVALFSATDVAGVSDELGPRIAQALDGVSVAAIAGCAVGVCWLLARGRIEFGPGGAGPKRDRSGARPRD